MCPQILNHNKHTCVIGKLRAFLAITIKSNEYSRALSVVLMVELKVSYSYNCVFLVQYSIPGLSPLVAGKVHSFSIKRNSIARLTYVKNTGSLIRNYEKITLVTIWKYCIFDWSYIAILTLQLRRPACSAREIDWSIGLSMHYSARIIYCKPHCTKI